VASSCIFWACGCGTGIRFLRARTRKLIDFRQPCSLRLVPGPASRLLLRGRGRRVRTGSVRNEFADRRFRVNRLCLFLAAQGVRSEFDFAELLTRIGARTYASRETSMNLVFAVASGGFRLARIFDSGLLDGLANPAWVAITTNRCPTKYAPSKKKADKKKGISDQVLHLAPEGRASSMRPLGGSVVRRVHSVFRHSCGAGATTWACNQCRPRCPGQMRNAPTKHKTVRFARYR